MLYEMHRMILRGLLVSVMFGTLISSAIAQPVSKPCDTSEDTTRPCVDKIDPPNWWADLSSPMLLLHGDHLSSAKIAVAGSGASIQKVSFSANGHYAFVWLALNHAGPQRLRIHLTNASGSVDVPFEISRRRAPDAGFKGFSSADVMYLIMTDRFANGDPTNDDPPNAPPGSAGRAKPRGWHGGDLRGIDQHLDYLQHLGITTVWTTPVYDNLPSPDSYHGYSATDVYAVDPHFGTLADYQKLAADLHQRGMKLVLDLVPNHIGPAHPWVKDEPMPDWFHGTSAHHDEAKGDFRSLPNPYSAPLESRDVIEGWFANVLPDMNTENPVVSKYLIQNAVWWIESAGLDGLRLDTFPYVGRAFWHDFHAELHTLYPHVTTVGEVFNPDPTITSFFAGGVAHRGIDTGLDTPFDFPMYFALRNVLIRNASMRELDNVLRQDWLFPHPERLVPFIGNHDTMRFLSEPGATPADLKLGFGLLATLRGMPQIYAGDEIAMKGGDDPDNRHDFPGGFPGDDPSAFTASGRTAEQKDVYGRASSLFQFRAHHAALQSGQQQDIFVDDTAFAFVRAKDVHTGCVATHSDDTNQRLLIVTNNSPAAREIAIETKDTALEGCVQFEPQLDSQSVGRLNGSRLFIQIQPKQLIVFSAQ
jgi:neopullulanase